MVGRGIWRGRNLSFSRINAVLLKIVEQMNRVLQQLTFLQKGGNSKISRVAPFKSIIVNVNLPGSEQRKY